MSFRGLNRNQFNKMGKAYNIYITTQHFRNNTQVLMTTMFILLMVVQKWYGNQWQKSISNCTKVHFCGSKVLGRSGKNMIKITWSYVSLQLRKSGKTWRRNIVSSTLEYTWLPLLSWVARVVLKKIWKDRLCMGKDI